MTDTTKIKEFATQVRRDIVRMTGSAGSGHPGGSLSCTDFISVLFNGIMEQDPKSWTREGKGQDMFFLSIGHVAPVYYSVLARSGYFPVAELATLRKMGSRLQGHPCVESGLPGIHQASGSLGQGLSVACGAALAKRLNKDDHRVFVVLGDGESEEGQVWEAGMFATFHKLDNLIAITDWNHQQIDGCVESVSSIGDLHAKWESFGWKVFECDGHNIEEIIATFNKAKAEKGAGKPIMVLMHTNMGQGVDFMCGTHKWHGKAPKPEEVENALAQLTSTSLLDY